MHTVREAHRRSVRVGSSHPALQHQPPSGSSESDRPEQLALIFYYRDESGRRYARAGRTRLAPVHPAVPFAWNCLCQPTIRAWTSITKATYCQPCQVDTYPEVRHPQLVRPVRLELPVDPVQRAWHSPVTDGGAHYLATAYAPADPD
jgi:hypothetical protein